MLSISVLAAAASVAAQGTPTQTPTPSPIDILMKSTKLKYLEQKDVYKVRYTMGETPRKHDVFVRMVTHEYRTLKVNEVFGLVWESDKAATHDQLITIFQKKYKMGGLIYELPSETQKNYRIRFAICRSKLKRNTLTNGSCNQRCSTKFIRKSISISK